MTSHNTSGSWVAYGVIGSVGSSLTGFVAWANANMTLGGMAALIGAIGSIVVPCFRILVESRKTALSSKTRIETLEAEIRSRARIDAIMEAGGYHRLHPFSSPPPLDAAIDTLTRKATDSLPNIPTSQPKPKDSAL